MKSLLNSTIYKFTMGNQQTTDLDMSLQIVPTKFNLLEIIDI